MYKVVFILLVFSSTLATCSVGSNKARYRQKGQLLFRRTYVVERELSETEADSLENSNPAYIQTTGSLDAILLNEMALSGYVSNQELLLNRIAKKLSDTIRIPGLTGNADTIWINYAVNKGSGSVGIYIASQAQKDRIPIRDEAFSHQFYLLEWSDVTKKRFVLLNQYSISNGDNFELTVYEKE